MNTVGIYAIALLLSGCLAFSNYKSKPYKDARQRCFGTLNIPINKFGNPVDKNHRQLKCLSRCILQRTGTFNTDNTPNYKNISRDANQVAKNCFNVSRQYDNQCRRANRFDKCMRNHDDETGPAKCREIDPKRLNLTVPANACNIRCSMIRQKFLDDQNRLTEEVLDEETESDLVEEIMTDCNGKHENELACDKAVKRYQCVLKYAAVDDKKPAKGEGQQQNGADKPKPKND